MTKTLPISEVKTHLPALVKGVAERADEVVVTKNGKPAAILMNIVEYESMKGTLELLSDPKAMAQIRKGREYFKRGGKGVDLLKLLED